MSARKFDPLVWGISLILFAAFVIAGTIAGGKYRYSWAVMEVPWGEHPEDVPNNPKEAWLWISFANDALAAGVSPQEIKKIYLKAKSTGTPIDTLDIPWPSYSRGKEKPAKTDNHEREEQETYPQARPGASPR
ncbi:MAG TPA: hypothetical protein VJU77_06350 [Chthoniobacterales bacterium]|nr:hypothetical protein [Chthoniobacterales bacterium]